MSVLAQVAFRSIRHYNSRLERSRLPSSPFAIAMDVLKQVFDAEEKTGHSSDGNGGDYGHFFVCTTTPDRLSPSLGQSIQAEFPKLLGRVPTHDLIQGCAGSVTNLCMAAELVHASKKPILFIAVDAAARAVSERSSMKEGFADGAFALIIEPLRESSQNPSRGLLKHCTIQYPSVRDTVLVGLGHHTRDLVQSQRNTRDFQKALDAIEDGVSLEFNTKKALQLAAQAPQFIEDFFADTLPPEMLILHQVNPRILNDVRKAAFRKYDAGFLDWSREVGNCGVSSPGVVLSANWEKAQGKRVFLCSYGTGGVISGSLWQL